MYRLTDQMPSKLRGRSIKMANSSHNKTLYIRHLDRRLLQHRLLQHDELRLPTGGARLADFDAGLGVAAAALLLRRLASREEAGPQLERVPKALGRAAEVLGEEWLERGSARADDAQVCLSDDPAPDFVGEPWVAEVRTARSCARSGFAYMSYRRCGSRCRRGSRSLQRLRRRRSSIVSIKCLRAA